DSQACVIKPTWNAAVCKGDIGRLTFNGPGGPGFGGARGAGPGGAGGAGGGAAGGAAGGRPPGAVGGGGAAAGPRGPRGPPPRPGGFGGGAPAQPAVVLSRNGKEYTVTGTNVRAGTEIKVTTERPSLFLNLAELDRGSWVVFELPGFATAASGTEQNN